MRTIPESLRRKADELVDFASFTLAFPTSPPYGLALAWAGLQKASRLQKKHAERLCNDEQYVNGPVTVQERAKARVARLVQNAVADMQSHPGRLGGPIAPTIGVQTNQDPRGGWFIVTLPNGKELRP